MDIVEGKGGFAKIFMLDLEKSADYHNNNMLVKSPDSYTWNMEDIQNNCSGTKHLITTNYKR